MAAHLRKVYDVCVIPNPDFGAKLGRMPDGSDVPSGDPYTREYWVGTTYYVAALMFRAGLKTEALNTAYGAFYPVYAADHLAYWFNAPEAWCDGGYTPRPRKATAWGQDHFSRAFEAGPDDKDEGSLTYSCPHQYQRPRAVWELVFEIQNDSYFYQCGDANRDGIVTVNDVVYLINYLFRNGPPPDPLEAGDANCDGSANSGDIVCLLNYLFQNGLPPCCP